MAVWSLHSSIPRGDRKPDQLDLTNRQPSFSTRVGSPSNLVLACIHLLMLPPADLPL